MTSSAVEDVVLVPDSAETDVERDGLLELPDVVCATCCTYGGAGYSEGAVIVVDHRKLQCCGNGTWQDIGAADS